MGMTMEQSPTPDDNCYIPCLVVCCTSYYCCDVGAAFYRKTLRDVYGIEGSILIDWLCMWCCLPCGACQMRAEVKIREAEKRMQGDGAQTTEGQPTSQPI
eukprot:898111_1